MDITETKRNLAKYKHNLIALQEIDTSILSFYEQQHLRAIQKRLTQLKNNVEAMLEKIGSG